MSASQSHTSSSLVERIKLRDQDAWNRLVYLYGPTVFGWCRSAGLQEEDAADVLQDVFLSIAAGIDRFQREHNQRGAFKAWIWRVTQSRIQDHFRRRSKGPAAHGGSEILRQVSEIPDPFSDKSETVSGAGDSSIVMRAAELVRSEFTDSTWQAFWQVAIEDKPTDIVAKQLNMSSAAVRQANYRVRRRLRAELEGIV